MQTASHAIPAPGADPNANPPSRSGQRQAAGAALAFEALKLSFLHVLAGLPAQQQLQSRVASASTPQALWHLRAHVFAAVSGTELGQAGRRQLLNRSLDSIQDYLEETASGEASAYRN